MSNIDIYNKFKSVPANALKPFDNGKFKGTDINTMWRIKCLTEQFGVCGFGWTTRVLRTWTEQGKDEEILAFAEIELKICIDEKWSEPITATGGNTMVKYIKSKGYYTNSDEAFKMAVTDAFGVACKYLGIGADVYWDNDRTKYTQEQENQQPTPKKSNSNPNAKWVTINKLADEKGLTMQQVDEWIIKKFKANLKIADLTEEQYTQLKEALSKK